MFRNDHDAERVVIQELSRKCPYDGLPCSIITCAVDCGYLRLLAEVHGRSRKRRKPTVFQVIGEFFLKIRTWPIGLKRRTPTLRRS